VASKALKSWGRIYQIVMRMAAMKMEMPMPMAKNQLWGQKVYTTILITCNL
jgi:hypothetical protein